MMSAKYYREHAARARRLAAAIATNRDISEQLKQMAQDYEELAIDIERGAIEVRHPELMPQTRRD